MKVVACSVDDSHLFQPGEGDILKAFSKRWLLDCLAGWCDPITGYAEIPHSWFTNGVSDA